MARAKRTRRSDRAVRTVHEEFSGRNTLQPLQDAATGVVPQLGTIALATAAAALVEAELVPAVIIGAGAALAPNLLRGVGYAIRPVAKTLIRAGYGTYRTAARLASEATDEVQDMVAEVRAGASV